MDYLPTPNAEQSRLIDIFVKGLESALDTTRTEISLAEMWKKSLPDGPEHNDIAEYLELVCLRRLSDTKVLLKLYRLEAILITTTHIMIWLTSEINTQRHMGKLRLSKRQCVDNGNVNSTRTRR